MGEGQGPPRTAAVVRLAVVMVPGSVIITATDTARQPACLPAWLATVTVHQVNTASPANTSHNRVNSEPAATFSHQPQKPESAMSVSAVAGLWSLRRTDAVQCAVSVIWLDGVDLGQLGEHVAAPETGRYGSLYPSELDRAGRVIAMRAWC